MIKKKTTRKKTEQKPAKTKSAKKKSTKKKKSAPKKQADAAQVHHTISGMVKSKARGITKAVMVHALQGHVAPARYLLEMAGVYPRATDGSQATLEEDCLAKTLLDRLNAAQKPGEEVSGASDEDGELARVERAVIEGAEDGSESGAGSE